MRQRRTDEQRPERNRSRVGGIPGAAAGVIAALLAAGSGVTPAAAATPSAAAAQIPAVDLGTLGGSDSSATAINDRGQIVGDSSTGSGATHAFLWQRGSIRDLGTLGGLNSSAKAINRLGQVVGSSQTSTGATHAFLWQRGVMTDLGTLDPADPAMSTVANGINDFGQIVGTATHVEDSEIGHVDTAVQWRHGVLSRLPVNALSATGINDRGQIAGAVSSATMFGEHAAIWQNGSTLDLGTLGDQNLQWDDYSSASAINDWGQVVGSTNTPPTPEGNWQQHGFSWRKPAMTDLGPVGGSSYAAGINDRGQIVGVSPTDYSWVATPVVWQNGKTTILGGLGFDWSSPAGINNSGTAVGYAVTPARVHRAVLWNIGTGT